MFEVVENKDTLEVTPKGTGTFAMKPGLGSCVYIERLTLYVWADINDEDPTHIIPLTGALELNRKDKDNDTH